MYLFRYIDFSIIYMTKFLRRRYLNLIVLIEKGSLQLLLFYAIIYEVETDILFSYAEPDFREAANLYTAGENHL